MVILEKCIYGMVNNLSFCRGSDKIIARPLFLFTFHSYIKYNANNVTFKPHECFVEIGNYGKKRKENVKEFLSENTTPLEGSILSEKESINMLNTKLCLL